MPPFGADSRRVRYLLRSDVTYELPIAFDSVLRMNPSLICACVSFQSVSITPLSRWSTTSRKPCSCQKRRICGHACSGVLLSITSQLSVPSRWMCMFATAGTTVFVTGAVSWTCFSVDSDVSPPCGGRER